ncbi:MAG: S-methyl-5-thioadenosine phosphorylase [Pseudomonadota bacterium]|jgi:5'-methylthioadenosine phosphorylase
MRIGVIGGSGVYQVEGLEDVRESRVDTPFGAPSDVLVHGRLGAAELVFLPRHGRGHRLNPSEVNYRANVWAMRQADVHWLISVSAVGSLQEHIAPGDVVLVDQFIDRTFRRAATYCEDGLVAHVPFADPVCRTLRGWLLESARACGANTHDGGTYVCMEGPQFSTKAESALHRAWGAAVVGMTNMPEAKLAREAGMSYASLAMATDYDCWHPHHDAVTIEQVLSVAHANAALAKRILRDVAPRIAAHGLPSPMRGVLGRSILTAPERIPDAARARLSLLLEG